MAAVEPIIQVRDLGKTYKMDHIGVRALRGVSLSVMPGEFVAVMGPSGSGKSTFMNLIGCLDRPTTGTYLLEGVPVSGLDRNALARVRNRRLGFVFQGFNLLSKMDALDNVELPMLYAGVPAAESKRRAEAALQSVGLADRMKFRPAQISGGQQQRVAVARALVNQPALILADEPTGNLDSRASVEIMAIFQRLNRELGMTLMLVTHEHDIAECAGRIVHFKDGRIVDDVAVAKPRDAVAEAALLSPAVEEEDIES